MLDANVFIQASRRHYAFDIAPRFWDSLLHHAANGEVRSIDRVLEELERGKDDLAAWAHDNFNSFFDTTDDGAVIQTFSDIMVWVHAQSQFLDAAKADFARGADGWLVAYAKVKNSVVVTHEVLNPAIRSKVPIPNMCQPFSVPYIDTFDMLRRLGVRL